jgi:acid phosphatase
VLVLGDWGTGEEGQRHVARMIAVIHGADPPDFVITVGDNFYPNGVESVDDPLWSRAFEDIYRGPFWDVLTFRPTLGNHDYEGDASAQLDYSNRNPRWDFPAPYYAYSVATPDGGRVLLMALDSEPIHRQKEGSRIQLQWVDSVLKHSDHDRVVVYGHHPVVSDGPHGDSEEMLDEVLPLLLPGADVYLSGHDHVMDLRPLPGGLMQAVCGNGAGADHAYMAPLNPVSIVTFTGAGWCLLKIWKEVLAIELYDGHGNIQYRQLVRDRRSQKSGSDP